MQNSLKAFARLAAAAVLVAAGAVAASAQVNTSGTVTVTGTVSKFVELNSGGAVTLSGNSGGGVSPDGSTDGALLVGVALGELGPANASSFVTASVPLKMRSNTNYVLSMSATVNSTASGSEALGAADIGFGIGTFQRQNVAGVNNNGNDSNATSGDPTLAANGSVAASGRYQYAAGKTNLGAFSSSSSVLSGDRILNAVPRTNTNGLTVPAVFAVKPQFYAPGSVTAVATFTIAAP